MLQRRETRWGSRTSYRGWTPVSGTPSLQGASAAVHVRRERTDERQVPVLLRVVEAVADDELVGNVEPDPLYVDRDLRGLRLAQQRAHLEGSGLAGSEVGDQPGECEPGVDDVLDDQDVL